MSDQSRTVGHVVSVSGSRIDGILHAPATDAGAVLPGPPIQIGSVVSIAAPSATVYGIVNSLRISDPSPELANSRQHILKIDLLGEAMDVSNGSVRREFRRGVSQYPPLGASIAITPSEELGAVYARPDESNVRVGTLFQDSEIPAYIVTDDLLGKHFAILGTTGSGKSCAVALILHAILRDHPNGHVVLLDPHNEYAPAFGEMAELLSPDNLQLPYWLLNFEEICEVLVDSNRPDAAAQVEILSRASLAAKRAFLANGTDSSHLTVDTPTPYNLSELLKNIDAAMGQLDKPESSLPYLRLKNRLDSLRGDRRFGFMFAGLMVRDSLSDIIARILRIPVEGKPVTILDLSGVPSEIVDIVVSVMCRMIFDYGLWSTPEESVPVLLVCEEAHRYVPADPGAGFSPTKNMLARIAKEGRKYGISLCLVTQRPSELSTSILSQCSTLIALRMSNDQDQDFVSRALPEAAKGLLSALPSLRVQEAIVVGEGVTVPMRLRFDDLDATQRPRSDSAAFSEAWRKSADTGAAVPEIVKRWRLQLR